MDFSKYTIGFGITGSFCTHEKIKKEIQRLVDLGATVIPVFSYQTQSLAYPVSERRLILCRRSPR